jgi:hypothetical protein
MSLVVAIPVFAVFAACCMAQMTIADQIRQSLRQRHREQLSGSVSFFQWCTGGLDRFIRHRPDIVRVDEALAKQVTRYKTVRFLGFLAWLSCGVVVIFGMR